VLAGLCCRHAPLDRCALMGEHSREQLFALIRAHLADELDLDPGAIG